MALGAVQRGEPLVREAIDSRKPRDGELKHFSRTVGGGFLDDLISPRVVVRDGMDL